MNNYLTKILSQMDPITISSKEIFEYKQLVISEMMKMGDKENDINLLREGSIKYAIINNRKQEDLA